MVKQNTIWGDGKDREGGEGWGAGLWVRCCHRRCATSIVCVFRLGRAPAPSNLDPLTAAAGGPRSKWNHRARRLVVKIWKIKRRSRFEEYEIVFLWYGNVLNHSKYGASLFGKRVCFVEVCWKLAFSTNLTRTPIWVPILCFRPFYYSFLLDSDCGGWFLCWCLQLQEIMAWNIIRFRIILIHFRTKVLGYG